MDVLELHDIRFDPGYDPTAPASLEHFEELIRLTEAKFLERTTAEWLETLTLAGVPAGPIRFAEAMVDDPQAVANALILRQVHSIVGDLRTVGPAARNTHGPAASSRPSPALGQHTEEVLTEMGIPMGEMKRLRRDRAFG